MFSATTLCFVDDWTPGQTMPSLFKPKLLPQGKLKIKVADYDFKICAGRIVKNSGKVSVSNIHCNFVHSIQNWEHAS